MNFEFESAARLLQLSLTQPSSGLADPRIMSKSLGRPRQVFVIIFAPVVALAGHAIVFGESGILAQLEKQDQLATMQLTLASHKERLAERQTFRKMLQAGDPVAWAAEAHERGFVRDGDKMLSLPIRTEDPPAAEISTQSYVVSFLRHPVIRYGTFALSALFALGVVIFMVKSSRRFRRGSVA